MKRMDRISLVALALAVVAAPPARAESADLDARAMHVLDRLGYGPRPGDLQRVEAMGIGRYIDQQLYPQSFADPDTLTKSLAGLRALREPPARLWRETAPPPLPKGQKPDSEVQKAFQRRENDLLEQARQARLLRALYSPAQLQEVMTDFWFNHFNVFAGKGMDKIWVGQYEEDAIRPHALGRFRDLLGATAHHAAMLYYLDNFDSAAPDSPVGRARHSGLNENYARELMELHTLGADGGYTQQDVITLARILTGWTFKWRDQMDDSHDGFYFDPRRHDFADKVFLGRRIDGSGEAEGEQALDRLARSPATARHISRQLAQYFVADDPDPQLVKTLAARWTQTDGDISEVLRALFHSKQFWSARNMRNKFKTPYQYVVSGVRASGLPVVNTRPLQNVLQQMGEPIYGYLTPDGYKDAASVWLSPDAMARRLNYATALAGDWMHLTVPPSPDNRPPGTPKPVLRTQPVDASQLARTLGGTLSRTTLEAALMAPQNLRAAVILGSPEFMRR